MKRDSKPLDRDTRALIQLSHAVSAIIRQLHTDSIEITLTTQQARTCLGACIAMQEVIDIKQEAERNQKGQKK